MSSSSKYSICITNYNKGPRVRSSLESFLHEIDGNFEFVVTDNFSNDGSEKILRQFASEGKIKLIERKSTRGKGRQLSFENSSGEYVISGLDTDDAAIPGRLTRFLDFYHQKCEGKLLRAKEGGVTIAPRPLILEIGGWRDLQFGENWDVSERAARINRYAWTIFKVTDRIRLQKSRRVAFIKRNKWKYTRYRDFLRLKHTPFLEGERVGTQEGIDYLLAWLALFRHGHLNPDPKPFTSYERDYFVDSNEYWHTDGKKEQLEVSWYERYLKKVPDWASTTVSNQVALMETDYDSDLPGIGP